MKNKFKFGSCRKYIIVLALLCICLASCSEEPKDGSLKVVVGTTAAEGSDTDTVTESAVAENGGENATEDSNVEPAETTGQKSPFIGDEDYFAKETQTDAPAATVDSNNNFVPDSGDIPVVTKSDPAKDPDDGEDIPVVTEGDPAKDPDDGEDKPVTTTTARSVVADAPDETAKNDSPASGNVTTAVTTAPLIQVLPDGGLLLPDDEWE